MNVDRQTAIKVAEEINAAIDAVFAKHGLAKGKTSSRYGETFKFTVEAGVVSLNEAGVNTTSPEATDFLRNARMYAFESGIMDAFDAESLFGATMTYQGTQWTFVGSNSRARKFPLLFKKVADGKVYKFPADMLSRIIKVDANA